MTRIKLVAAVPLLSLLAACAPPKPDLGAEKAALMQTSRDWSASLKSGDVEKIIAYWADDAVVMPPGSGSVVGKTAIREFVKQALAVPGFTMSWEPETASIGSSGDIGYLVERNSFGFADSAGTVHMQSGKAVTVWRKDAKGAWKCVLDTWNADAPAPAAKR